jgi:predicted nucleotidyltransferase
VETKLGFLVETERKVIASLVKDLQEMLGDEILSIRLFGSRARGDFNEDSDIDLFILVREKTSAIREKVSGLIADYIFDYDLPLSAVLYDLLESQKNMELGSFFFENVEKEGIPL